MHDAPRILFLDEDHVLRTLRLILCDADHDAQVRGFFAPERPDLGPLIQAAAGLRRSDGALVGQATDPKTTFNDATLLVFRRGVIDQALFEKHPRLRLVQRLGARANDIDLAGAAARGVRVSCLPRVSLDHTAEHTFLLMLALAKRLIPADRAVRAGIFAEGIVDVADGVAYNWSGIDGASGLSGKTLGVIGLGEVGTLVARIARAFGMRVVYHQRRRATPEHEREMQVTFVSQDELLAAADFVSLHASNAPENRGLAGREFFAGMKSSAYLVNTSRGALVDEDALYDALTRGVIAGAGLDVHAVEPRAGGDRFAALPNVVLSPHIAGGSRSGIIAELQSIVLNLQAALRGAPLLHQVGAATGASQ